MDKLFEKYRDSIVTDKPFNIEIEAGGRDDKF